MKKIFSFFIFCCLAFIIAFMLFGDVEGWVEKNLGTQQSLLTYSVLSFALLLSDIVLPIPSSLVMIVNGKILGIVAGTALSLVAGVVSSSIGFYLGRKTNPVLNKIFSRNDVAISRKVFKKYGSLAIAISKALPIISEAISFVAGTTPLRFTTFLMYSIAGHAVVSLIYAVIGDMSSTLDSSIIAALVILAALATGWILQLIITRKAVKK